MSDDFELIRGSGNVFRDLGYPDADLRHAKAVLAAEIIKALDERQWSTRRAEEEPASITPILPASAGRTLNGSALSGWPRSLAR